MNYLLPAAGNLLISILTSRETHKILMLLFILFININARKPPGFIPTPKEYDPDPPKYEYGYRIEEDKNTHGKDEQRDGIYAKGRYYVNNGTESSQNVNYFADDWGYHSVVEYSNVGPYSKSSTNFVLGEEAIKLKNQQKIIPHQPEDDPDESGKNNLFDPDTHNTSLENSPILNNPEPSQQVLIDPINSLENDPIINRNFTEAPLYYFIPPPLSPPSSSSDTQIPTLQTLPQIEILPTPQPLITSPTTFYYPSEQENHNLPTAALVKQPNKIVHFGTRLNSKPSSSSTKLKNIKLVESTKDLVSGSDVLNLNAAAAAVENVNVIETNTLHNLLEKFVSPTLASSTTVALTSLLKQPIIVADNDAASDPNNIKPVTDDNVEDDSIISALSVAEETHPASSILITPKPESGKFIHHQFQHRNRERGENIEVQKTIPYYLGMFEYPLGYDNNNNNGTNEKTSIEQKAVDNIELGNTLLYFPGENNLPQPEKLILNNAAPDNGAQNKLDNSIKDAESEKNLNIIEKPIPYNNLERPIEITKYVDRPYPVEVHVPIPQPYPVEKIVEKPVEKIVERKIPVPYFIDRPVSVPDQSSQALLVQIPGLFSKGSYRNLVQNFHHDVSPLTTSNSYKRPHQALKKLNLLVFPSINIANLPPITKNSLDLTFRESNAQLNNGYLPPDNHHSESVNTNYYNAKNPEGHLGLVPPKRSFKNLSNKNRQAKYFDGNSIRLEYGFMPPLIPSLEIDEQGRPIEKMREN